MPFRHSGTTTATIHSSATFVNSEVNQDKTDSNTAPSAPPHSKDEMLTMAESDPFPHLDGTPVVPGLELPASTPGRLGLTPEMPGQGLPQIGRVELSPDPERLLINGPSTSARSYVPVPPTDSDRIEHSSFMRSNLNTSRRSQENRQASRKNGRISWMDYENQEGLDVTRNSSVENVGSAGLGIQGATIVR